MCGFLCRHQCVTGSEDCRRRDGVFHIGASGRMVDDSPKNLREGDAAVAALFHRACKYELSTPPLERRLAACGWTRAPPTISCRRLSTRSRGSPSSCRRRREIGERVCLCCRDTTPLRKQTSSPGSNRKTFRNKVCRPGTYRKRKKAGSCSVAASTPRYRVPGPAAQVAPEMEPICRLRVLREAGTDEDCDREEPCPVEAVSEKDEE